MVLYLLILLQIILQNYLLNMFFILDKVHIIFFTYPHLQGLRLDWISHFVIFQGYILDMYVINFPEFIILHSPVFLWLDRDK